MEQQTNPTMVRATYSVNYFFKIPDGVDLDDSNQVSDHWIKWNVLNIEMVDGTTHEIEPLTDTADNDLKRPDEICLLDTEFEEVP